MSSRLILVFLLVTLLNLACSTANHGGNETDSISLLAFKSALHDPQGILDSWNHSLHFCMWEGVTCGRLHKRVTKLNLESSGLSGSLSPHIGNLSFLQTLSLPQNNFTGNIPNEIGRLFRLRVLVLQNNSFEGEIPANLSYCTNLEQVLLRRNKLVGKIPRELGSLSKLKVLAISRNNLSGELPSFIRNLTSLEFFFATLNLFKGRIPNNFGELRVLTGIDLGGNELSGTIPSSIYNISSLALMSLADNKLVGTLPQDLGLRLPRIRELQMWKNYFHGTIPLSLSNASELQKIDFSINNFTGKVPNLGGVRNLTNLVIENSNLGTTEGADEMSILINSLTNCSLLQKFSVFDNHFRGTIPNSVGNLSTDLREFGVAINRLNGVIPLGLGNLEKLERIQMGDNQFEGQIPNDIGKLQNLNKLHLFTNQLSGQIPIFLGNMSMLSLVFLDDNKFEGSIPSSLGNCKNLIWLNISRNNLGGTIPKELFDASSLSISLDLSNNQLVGQIPSDVGKLKNLVELDLSENKLSAEIPANLGSCTSLEVLYLHGNFLNGSIPRSLKSLSSLQHLDLSSNNLSGLIPKFLENFHLNSLNLSFNDFSGQLPTQGVFANASVISVDGNSQLCGGVVDMRLPRCKNATKKPRRLSLVHVVLIAIGCSIVAIFMVWIFIVCWRKNTRNARNAQSAQSSKKESFLKISYADLVKATNGFSSTNIIGLGSFGSVYKGILDQNEMVVAVKVLNLERYGATKSFLAECKAWRNLRHRNLLKIITSCSSTDFSGNDFKALVYEFMPNGSLERWLHSDEEKLNLHQRIDIAVDVAYALDYLHHQCGEPIIHCDLKPSNVLLDEDMVAHVGDFGSAKFAAFESSHYNQNQSVGVKGTVGYAAPEYGLGNEMSTNGDIYSYGILLLEMMTSKSPTDPMFNEVLNLHNYAKAASAKNVMEIVDLKLLHNDKDDIASVSVNNGRTDREEYSVADCVVRAVNIGVACSRESPEDRIGLNDVIRQLKLIKRVLEVE